MSGIIHSLRTLFGSPSTDNNNRPRTRRLAREEEADNHGGDDDVFSAFGDDDDAATQPDDDATQPPDETEKGGGDDDDDDGHDDERGQNDENTAQQHGESLTSSGTITTTAGQSLATQMTAGAGGGRSSNDDHGMMEQNDQEEATAAASDGGATNDERAETTGENGGRNNNNIMATSDQNNEPSEAASSPLTEFFAHMASNDDKVTTLAHQAVINERERQPMTSLSGWREARKTILREYLTRRLIRMEDDESMEEDGGENCERADDIGGGDNKEDDCSFSSDVLDESFSAKETEGQDGAGENNAASNNDNEQHHGDESEDEDDDQMLETQPQTVPPLKNTPKLYQTQEEEAEQRLYSEVEGQSMEKELQTQEEENLTPRREAIFGGIKRKLGFVASKEPDGGTEEMPENSNDNKKQQLQPPAKKRSRKQQHNGQSTHRQRRGLMWDGRFESITHVDDATSQCSKLSELDLSSQTLNLSLCRVLRVWDVRLTKRMEQVHEAISSRHEEDTAEEDQDAAANEKSTTVYPNHAMIPFEFYEDDGPLNAIYKRVFSIEIAHLLDDDQGEEINNPLASTIATAAFYDGKHQLDKEISRKNRHAVRRIKVFFYNAYADVMSKAFYDLRKSSLEKKQQIIPFLMSLVNIPAECILPHSVSPNCHPHLARYVNNPFGNEEFGTLSPYCICIGNKSTIKLGGEKMHFDCDNMEVRVVEMPMKNWPPLANSIGGENEFSLDDAVITKSSIRSNADGYYFMEGDESNLLKRYVAVRKRKSITPEPILFHPQEEENASDNHDSNEVAPSNNVDVTGRRGSSEARRGGFDARSAPMPSGESTASAVVGTGIVRPRSVVPLCNLLPLLQRNNTPKLRDPINVYGVVLGFSAPSLTRTEEWVMSIVLIDDTSPLPNQMQNLSNNVGNTAGNNSTNPKEMHVPSVTLVLFSKDKSKLPVVRSAGDVICCQKVFLQTYNGPQLCAKKTSSIVIVRPRQARCPGDDELHNSMSPNDWSASCSCHESNDEIHSTTQWQLVDNLWRWGQHRLSVHPTMSPNCHLSIDNVGDYHNNNGNNNLEVSISGDLTAAVTAIIPMPEHLRRRDTPRGYIRLWDGTGPSRTDPLPLNPTAGSIPNQPPHNDPPQKVLIEIEKILANISSSSECPPENLGGPCNIQAPISLCGRVINAIIWEDQLWNLIYRENIIDVGSFIRLRNINNAKLPSGTNSLSVHVKSSMTPLPFDAYEVIGLLKGHDARLRRGVPHNPTSAILPPRSSSSRTDIVQEMKNNGISMIEECLQKPPPDTFTVQFEVSNTIPACNPTSTDALQTLYSRKKDGTSSFRFALHIKDSSSEIDVLCIGEAAEQMLGIKVKDIIEKSERCEDAIVTLKEIMSFGSICEGKIRSILGKDGKLYFILKSMFCITAETS
ncbi:hypothetical protein ACHAXR_013242 [Thalassiosira sp. AJA248-18]